MQIRMRMIFISLSLSYSSQAATPSLYKREWKEREKRTKNTRVPLILTTKSAHTNGFILLLASVRCVINIHNLFLSRTEQVHCACQTNYSAKKKFDKIGYIVWANILSKKKFEIASKKKHQQHKPNYLNILSLWRPCNNIWYDSNIVNQANIRERANKWKKKQHRIKDRIVLVKEKEKRGSNVFSFLHPDKNRSALCRWHKVRKKNQTNCRI